MRQLMFPGDIQFRFETQRLFGHATRNNSPTERAADRDRDRLRCNATGCRAGSGKRAGRPTG